jgi:hypothetical protein
MFPYNTLITESPTGELCQTTDGAKAFLETLPYNPVIVVSHKRALANARQESMITGEGWKIPYQQDTRYWDSSNIPNLPSYADSDGVQMAVWYNQANLNLNLTGLAQITPGMSMNYETMTGAGIFPCFQNTSAGLQHANTYDGSFTWIGLVRFSNGGANVTSGNWRTTGSNFLIDGRIGTSNDDLCMGVDTNFIWVGMGTAGGADTFLQGTYDVVEPGFADPKLVVLRRDATTGTVALRINKINDGSAVMTTGSLANMPNIMMKPVTGDSRISELYLYNDYIDDATLLQIENDFQAFYDLSI